MRYFAYLQFLFLLVIGLKSLDLIGAPIEVIQKKSEVKMENQDNDIKSILTNSGELKFKWNSCEMELFEESELRFEENHINLLKGIVRIRNGAEEALKVKTPVSTVTLLQRGDYLIHYQPEFVQSIVEVLTGGVLLQGHYREEVLNLQAQERGHFKGIKEDELPAYDILLKGKKSIRGTLLGPEKLTEVQAMELEKQYSIIIQKKVVKKVKPKPKPGQICVEPFAKYNECTWRCQSIDSKKMNNCTSESKGISCIQERCLADGQWGDRLELKGKLKNRCFTGGENKKIGPCYY